ncbi:Gfo/Idh/MocA family oxidoreductase [Candidatus Saganbacteria bacterium]|nr:Gfo/Idh/MocA family oxidoreductase [Candidatus Saganbacteria bacterium]
MNKIKVGVVGAGVMGDHHARIYSTLNEAKLIGLYDPDPARSGEVAARYGCASFPDIISLASSVDALSIASPTSTHYSIALDLLRAGKHLLIEKPIALDVQQAEELCSLAQERGLLVAVGMIERFNPAIIRAASLLKKEMLLGLTFKRFSPYPARIFDASVVMDVMIHDLDLALSLAGVELDSYRSSGRTVRSSTPDEAEALLYFKDGLIARVMASRVKDQKERSLQAITDRSIYEIDLLNKTVHVRSFSSLSDRSQVEVKAADQLTLELKDFLSAIAKGREPEVPCTAGLKALKLALGVENQIC